VEHFHEQLQKQQNYEPGWTVTRLANVVRLARSSVVRLDLVLRNGI
jgi:hypothetical protein